MIHLSYLKTFVVHADLSLFGTPRWYNNETTSLWSKAGISLPNLAINLVLSCEIRIAITAFDIHVYYKLSEYTSLKYMFIQDFDCFFSEFVTMMTSK